MDQIKAQDIIRHIFKDDDKGFNYFSKMSLDDNVETLTKLIPELIQKAEDKGNANDVGYFNSLSTIFTKIVIDKLMKAEHLWVVYSSTTSYPYMMDDDLVVLYDYKNHEKVEMQLLEHGYKVNLGIETPGSFFAEIGHMYRNGYKNIRVTDGDDNMLIIPREDIEVYQTFFKDDYITNPGLQNAMISYFQEFRRPGEPEDKEIILKSYEMLMNRALINAELMVPCIKEETEEEVSISHPYLDLTDRIPHKDGENVYALPVFTDGFEMDKVYKGQNENMLYKFTELIKSVEEIGAAGIVINPLGISHYMPLESMRMILNN